jgi:hypothetical protein
MKRKTNILEVEIEELKKSYNDERPENWDGILGYEEEPLGDGIYANYFNNEVFSGSPIKYKDDNIDFDWDGEPPKERISAENFSVRWEGFLKAPVTGDYYFTAVADDCVSINLN